MITAEQLCEWQAALNRKQRVVIRAGDLALLLDVAMPALLDEVKRLRALLRDWDAACKGHCDTEAIAARVAEALR